MIYFYLRLEINVDNLFSVIGIKYIDLVIYQYKIKSF